jgi:hypothetical protein
MIDNLNREIVACKRRMGVLCAFIDKTKTAGNPSIEVEQQTADRK